MKKEKSVIFQENRSYENLEGLEDGIAEFLPNNSKTNRKHLRKSLKSITETLFKISEVQEYLEKHSFYEKEKGISLGEINYWHNKKELMEDYGITLEKFSHQPLFFSVRYVNNVWTPSSTNKNIQEDFYAKTFQTKGMEEGIVKNSDLPSIEKYVYNIKNRLTSGRHHITKLR